MLAIELHGMHPFVLILICLAIGLSLRRSARRCRRFEPIRYATRELKAKKETTQAKVYQHRIQLHDTARETQAVLQAQVAVLDQIAGEADRDIRRLEELLQEIRDVPTPRLAEFCEESEPDPDEPFLPSAESAEFVRVLHRSGFSAEEIAGSMRAPLDVIRGILGESDDGSSKAA
jgi:hypothetical protein